MTLRSPTPEDQRKIHAEVNQIANHRFLVTTAAITLFGVMAAWIMQRTSPSKGQELDAFVWLVSSLLCLLLTALFMFQVFLKRTLRMYTSYLVETKASMWEQDWADYRHGFPYSAYGKPITYTFLVLILCASFLPLVVSFGFDLKVSSSKLLLIHAVAATVSTAATAAAGLFGWLDNERQVTGRWRDLNQQGAVSADAGSDA